MKLHKNQKIHFIGIGGVSQSKLALMLKNFGFEVSGSDRQDSTEVKELRSKGIKVFVPHNKNAVDGADVVVFNGAISEDNPELNRAGELGLKIVKRSQMLAKLSRLYKESVAVCGSHGKTTTTALLNFVLEEFEPQMHIGGNLIGVPFEVSNKKDLFVSEACEFQKSFLDMSPDYAVMLNIDADHLDCYAGGIEEIESTFLQFAKQVKKVLIFNNEDERAKRVARKAKHLKTISFGKGADVEAYNVRQNKKGLRFELFYKGEFVCPVTVKLYGRHGVLNTLAACAAAIVFGRQDICEKLKNFAGVERRMQFLGKLKDNVVVHDYAHHPEEIAASIKAVRQHFRKPVVAVFEPHTYSRTKALWDDFTKCFNGAESVYLLPIYSARERALPGITSSNLADAVSGSSYVSNKAELIKKLENYEKCIILVMGAGSIEKIAHGLV